MGHVPHVVVDAPWEDDELELTAAQWRHLSRVLRMGEGEQLSYTDGRGRVGTGRLTAQGLARGGEREVARPSELTLAVAPPASKDRQRFVVEKLSELGVSRLQWLSTKHGGERIASPDKVRSWAVAATEQSRGAWVMETTGDMVGIDELDGPMVFCHPGGVAEPSAVRTVVIGPEGGFDDDELPHEAALWHLGPTILRVETAAIVAASRLISP